MSKQPDTTARSWWWLLLWSVLFSLAGYWQGATLLHALWPQPGNFPDFCQEWLSAQNVVHGRPVYRDQNVSVREYTPHKPRSILQWNAHPPTSVLLAVPLTPLEYSLAHLAWNVLSLAALGGSLFLIGRHLGFGSKSLLPLCTLLLLCYPFQLQVFHGQLTLILLLLIVGSWALNRTGHETGAGVLIGVATAIKLFPALFFLYFLVRGQWRALAAGVLCLVGLTGLTLAVEGWDAYQTYATVVLPSLSKYRSSWQNISLPGFWSRLFDPQPIGAFRVVPLWSEPSMAWAMIGLSTGLVLLLLRPVVQRARTRTECDGAFSLMVTAMLLVSPICWVDYCLLLLLPVAWLWQRMPSRWLRFILLATLLPLWVRDRILYYAGTGFDADEYRTFLEGQTATPLHSLTLLSFQFYALLAVFVLHWLVARWHLSAETAPADSAGAAGVRVDDARESRNLSDSP